MKCFNRQFLLENLDIVFANSNMPYKQERYTNKATSTHSLGLGENFLTLLKSVNLGLNSAHLEGSVGGGEGGGEGGGRAGHKSGSEGELHGGVLDKIMEM